MSEQLFVSRLAAPPEEIWRRVTHPAGLQDEFSPWLTMGFPEGVDSIGDLPTDPPWRSWLRLFGVLPVEFDDIVLVEYEAPHRFLERSAMGFVRVWEHERTLEAEGTGTRITDRVAFEMRIPALAPVADRIVEAVFAHRHRRLRRRFGAADR